MAWSSSDAAIQITPEIQAALDNASIEEMKDILHTAAVNQGLAVPDVLNSSILHETELAKNAPRKFTRTITLNAQAYTLEADSPEELNDTEIQFWRDVTAPPQEQQRNERGQFVAAEDPATSAAVAAYLKNRGVDPADLQQVAGRGYVARWSDSADAFKAAHPEYEANDANMKLIGDKLIELGLEDSPSLESLERAYDEVAGSLAAPETEFAQRLAEAQTAEEIAQLSADHYGTSRQTFGRL